MKRVERTDFSQMDQIEGNDWAAVMGPHRPKWRQWSRNNRFAEIRLSDRAKITLVELFSLEDIRLLRTQQTNTHNVRRSCSPSPSASASASARQRQDRSRHAEEWYSFFFTCYEKTNQIRQELAHPQESLPAHRRAQIIREATPRPKQSSSHERAREGNEGRKRSRATGPSFHQMVKSEPS